MKKNRFTILFMCLGLTICVNIFGYAQDPHFSQFFASPLYNTPTSTGLFNGDYRFSSNYRNQWNSVTKPFTTFAASFDAPVTKRLFGKNILGVGIILLRDKAGDSDFGITSGALSINYHQALNAQHSRFLSFSIQTGIRQTSLDYTKLRFGDQFDGSSYDPALSSSEKFGTDHFNVLDIGFGIQYSVSMKKGKDFFSGLYVYHLNEPTYSLYENSPLKLRRKYSLYSGAVFPASRNIDLVPGLMISEQNNFHEVLWGSQVRIKKSDPEAGATDFTLGIFNRWNDAMIFCGGMTFKQYTMGISYDVNVSSLKKASIYRGGVELSLMAIFGKINNPLHRQVTCPIF